ncbi:permease [Pseudoalteromonas fenneropenaei]|uniref:Permease n=1 Tax=Pseudoalteromonas fenneropenaei TaxID=1737459 RepID=A0ABV7CJ12_9GAMM
MAADFFVSAFTELAILFLIISMLVSAVNLYLPTSKITTLLTGNTGYGVAMGLGAITPFCSCSTLPMLVGLIRANASFGPLMAFLITSPLLNPFVISLFWITFSPAVTIIYSICVITMAGLSGALLQKFNFQSYIRPELFEPLQATCKTACTDDSEPVQEVTTCSSKKCGGTSKISPMTTAQTLMLGALKQLKEMLPYMVLGVAIGALLHGFVPVSAFDTLATINVYLLIPLSALIGIFLYVRASTMIPIAASMIAKGLSVGAVMSLTIAGAGASLPEMIMLRKMFKWPLLIAFVLLVLATAIVTGFTIELLAMTI